MVKPLNSVIRWDYWAILQFIGFLSLSGIKFFPLKYLKTVKWLKYQLRIFFTFDSSVFGCIVLSEGFFAIISILSVAYPDIAHVSHEYSWWFYSYQSASNFC